MAELTAEDTGAATATGRLDGLLRFHPRVERQYEIEHGQQRISEMRHCLFVGLIFYNVYNFTNTALMPDISWLSAALRVLVVTPITFASMYAVGHISPKLRELLALNFMIGLALLPIYMFWLTDAPLGAYVFCELTMTLTFGNMLLCLRFRDAIIFSSVVTVATVVAVVTKSGLDHSLRVAMGIQIVTASCFTIYAAYRMEARRGTDYLVALNARLVAEAANVARQQFQNLSQTDALTGLPNRRALDQQLDVWLGDTHSVAVMMIDVDHFKLFNDALGHPAGDDCLRKVATVFHALSDRPDTFFARFGGEEFTLAMRDVSVLEAKRIGTALIKAVNALRIIHPNRSDGVGFVTISAGIVVRQAESAITKATLLAMADTALYQAKRMGRNRCVLDDRPTGDQVAAR